MVDRLAAEDLGVHLAVSLHGPDDETRRRLIPTSPEGRVTDLVEAASRFARKTGRDVTVEYVLIAADDPDGMVRHTHECRQRGYPFIADPSQQLAFSDGALIRDLIDGATYLFSNEYESHMIESKTGWSAGLNLR